LPVGGTSVIDEKKSDVAQPEWHAAMHALAQTLSKTLSQSLTEQLKRDMKSMESRMEGRMVKNMAKAMSNRDPTTPVHPVDFSSMRDAYDMETSEDSDGDYSSEDSEHGPHQSRARNSGAQGPRTSSSGRFDAQDEALQDMYRAPLHDVEASRLQPDFPAMTRARSRNHRPANVRHHNVDGNNGRKVLDILKKYEGPKFVLSSKKNKYVDDWIRSFDNWYRGRMGDPRDPDHQYGDTAIRLVMLAVQDHTTASEWCRARMRKEPRTYESFMHDFSEAFMSLSESRRRVQVSFLQGERQRTDEPILRYNIKFKKRVDLHRAACEHANRIPDERLLLASYAAGLNDKQNSVRAMRRRSLNDAMQYLQNKEAIYREVLLARVPNSKGKDVDTDDETTSDDCSQDSSSDDNDSGSPKGTAVKSSKGSSKKAEVVADNWKDEIKSLSKGVQALSLLLNGQIKGLQARTPGAPRVTAARDMSTIQCYNCDEWGHYMSKCPKPLKPKALFAQQCIDSDPASLESVPGLAAFLAAAIAEANVRQQSTEEDF
jgi:hypothetical protein